jgi:cystathionine beta-lyase/cystathionine gamma-synthase
MTDRPTPHRDTLAITSGRADQHGALAPVLWSTTTFSFRSVEEASTRATTPRVHDLYGRYGNPTVRAFEETVAALEGAETALAFASGMGAITTVLLTLCGTGSHAVVQRQIYSSTWRIVTELCPRLGIEVTVVDGTDTAAIEAAVEPGKTMLVFVETPANPRNDLVDLAAVGALKGPITVCDSTFATPMVQRPLEHGIDLVLHSATKGLGGHNDSLLGVVAGSEELLTWIWGYHTFVGAAASPAEAHNAVRGLRTLAVRLERQCETAQRLAEVIEAHPAVEQVLYPGLHSHPQRELALRQMDSGGPLVAVVVAGGVDGGRRFAESVTIPMLAPSLGGPETLISHPASMTHVDLSPEDRREAGIADGLLRISVGLEHPDDLVADVVSALDAVAAG